MIGATLSIFAGLCAALGSVCAKLALNVDTIIQTCTAAVAALPVFGGLDLEKGLGLGLVGLGLENKPICETISLYLQVLSFCGIFIFNALMWTLFVKSLQLSKSSVQATVTNSASNFFFSAFIGHVLFGEPLGVHWWIGSILIVFGLILMQKGSENITKEKRT